MPGSVMRARRLDRSAHALGDAAVKERETATIKARLAADEEARKVDERLAELRRLAAKANRNGASPEVIEVLYRQVNRLRTEAVARREE